MILIPSKIHLIEDKNPPDEDGWTPLHIAAKLGHVDVCKLIAKNVEDLDLKNNDGDTPLTLSVHPELILFFKAF